MFIKYYQFIQRIFYKLLKFIYNKYKKLCSTQSLLVYNTCLTMLCLNTKYVFQLLKLLNELFKEILSINNSISTSVMQ